MIPGVRPRYEGRWWVPGPRRTAHIVLVHVAGSALTACGIGSLLGDLRPRAAADTICMRCAITTTDAERAS